MLPMGQFGNGSAGANVLEIHLDSWRALTLLVGWSDIQCNVEGRTQHYRVICSAQSEMPCRNILHSHCSSNCTVDQLMKFHCKVYFKCTDAEKRGFMGVV